VLHCTRWNIEPLLARAADPLRGAFTELQRRSAQLAGCGDIPQVNSKHLFRNSMTADRLNSRAPSRHGPGPDRGPGNQPQTGRAVAREPAPPQAVSTPQSSAQQINGLQILIALLLAPLAWLAQVGMAEMVLGGPCTVGGPLFVVHAMPLTPAIVAVASLVCLIFGSVGAFVAWRNLWRTAHIPWRFPSALRGRRAELDWFLSRVCAMSSTMFILGLIATDIAMLVIAPCSPW
jgi:hypothetical protein